MLAQVVVREVERELVQARGAGDVGRRARGEPLQAHADVVRGAALVDRAGELGTVLEDITKRPFIVVGFTAFVLLLPLAATSSKWAIKRLGGRNWNRLHKLVYLIAILAVVHFIMRAKKDVTEAALHGAVLACLLGVRIVDKLKRSTKQRTPLTQ